MDANKAGQLSDAVLDSLDRAEGADESARRAYASRSSFFRLFQALIKESPGAMRRRFLLERAAWQLRDTRLSVTEIAFDASYGSLEAFTRAFRRAFKISPSLFRRTGSGRIHLPAPNKYHFRPDTRSKGASNNMDLFDLFAGTDSWYTRRLLQQAALLTEEQLDRPVNSTFTVFPWGEPDKSLREILERIVQTTEVWTAALTDADAPHLDERPVEDRTPAALLRRFETADAAFHSILRDVRDRNAWEETFVDALCEPPETFTYGGMFAHVVTFNAYRRMAALDAFHRVGVHVEGTGCPSEYETAMKPGGSVR